MVLLEGVRVGITIRILQEEEKLLEGSFFEEFILEAMETFD